MKRLIVPLVLVLSLALVALLWQLGSLSQNGALATPEVEPTPGGEVASEAGTSLPGITPPPNSATPRTDRVQVEATTDRIDPAAATGALLLRVVLEDDTPVPGIALFLSPERSRRIGYGTTEHLTDGEGLARVEDLRPGDFDIHCPRGRGQNVEVVAGQQTEVRFVLKKAIDVSGVVRDSAGQAVAGADVWMVSGRRDWLGNRFLCRTEADGSFVARHVNLERSLGATADGFAPSPLVDLELVETDHPPIELVLVLPAGGGNLHGTVRDPAGRPVPGARVAVGESPTEDGWRSDGTSQEFWCARVETTSADGSFSFLGLDAGQLPLCVVAADYPELRAEVEILPGETMRHDVELVPGMSVHGVVRDEAGNVVPEALVLALDEPFEDPFPTQGPTEKGTPFHRPAVRSDDSGAYRLDFLPAGEVHLHASRGTSFWDRGEFVGTVQTSLNGAVGESVEWNPVLTRGQAIRGRVVFADGRPMGNVFVSAINSDERRFTEHAGDAGKFTIPGLEHRAYRVSVQLWDEPDDALPLVQKDVWPSDAELLLTASFSKVVEEKGTVRVRIDDQAGRIEGQGGVLFAHDGGWYYSGEEDGVFQSKLPPGRYQARAVKGDTVVGYGEWFELAAGEVRDLGTVRTHRPASLVLTLSRPPELADAAMRARVRGENQSRAERHLLPPGVNKLTIEDLLEGHTVVEVWGHGVVRETRTIELPGDTPTPIHFRLRPAGQATIHIGSPETEGFGRLTIAVRRPNGELYHEDEFRERWGTELPFDFGVSVPPGRFLVEVTTATGLTASGELVATSLTERATLSLTLE